LYACSEREWVGRVRGGRGGGVWKAREDEEEKRAVKSGERRKMTCSKWSMQYVVSIVKRYL
jgi:hypothetical protein